MNAISCKTWSLTLGIHVQLGLQCMYLMCLSTLAAYSLQTATEPVDLKVMV